MTTFFVVTIVARIFAVRFGAPLALRPLADISPKKHEGSAQPGVAYRIRS